MDYFMEIDAVCLAGESGLSLEAAREVVRADWAAGGPGGMAWTFVVPADAERLAVAGDFLVEGQIVFRAWVDGQSVDFESPFAGHFESAEAGRFRVVRRA